MKNRALCILCCLGLSLFSACSRSSLPPSGKVPEDWLIQERREDRNLPAPARQGEVDSSSEWKDPSPETDAQIQSIFRMQGTALDRLSDSKRSWPVSQPFRLLHGGGDVPGEAPWHLNNFIAQFGVTVQGIFGHLVSDGGFAVKGIWQNRKAEKLQRVGDSSYAVRWNSLESRKKQLEPVIQSVLQTGLIERESDFRKNLEQASRRFEKIVRILENDGPDLTGWEISRFALYLNVDASGNITPALSVGAEITIRLDWDRPRKSDPLHDKVLLSSLEPSEKAFLEVLQSLKAQMAVAQIELGGLEGQEVNFENFHAAVGISASGNIGLVGFGGGIEGAVYFSRPGGIETIRLKSMIADSPALSREIPMILSDSSSVFIKPEAFNRGLKRALKMGSYFARMALASESTAWKLDEIETEFEIALSGSVGVVTVESEAHLALEFHFEGEK